MTMEALYRTDVSEEVIVPGSQGELVRLTSEGVGPVIPEVEQPSVEMVRRQAAGSLLGRAAAIASAATVEMHTGFNSN